MKNNPEKLLEKYHALGNQGQLVLQLLAIQVDSISKNMLAKCLSGLKIKGIVLHKVSPVLVGKITLPLEQKGLVETTKQGLRCPDELRPHVVLHALEKKEFRKLAKAVQRVISYETSGYYGTRREFANEDQLSRELQIASYSGRNQDEIHEILREAHEFLRLDDQGRDVFQRILPPELSTQLIRYTAPTTRINILQNILLWGMFPWHRQSEKYYDLLIHEYRTLIKEKGNYEDLLDTILLRGDCLQAKYFLEERAWEDAYEQLAYRGWFFFITGENSQALENFSQALTLYKKLHRKRKACLPGYPGLFHLLALIASGEPELMGQAYEQMAFMERKELAFADLVSPWKKLLEQQLGLPAARTRNRLLEDFAASSVKNPEKLFRLLPQVWLDPKGLKQHVQELKTIKAHTEESEYLWLSALAAELLAAAGEQRKQNTQYSEELHQRLGIVGLTGIVETKAEWEASLQTIINLAGGLKGGSGQQPEERLIWWFDYDEGMGWLTLEPRLQKKSKTGKWSKGRPVALKKLSDNAADMAGLTEQDRRICATIKQYYESSGWDYHRKLAYRFDPEQALPQLIDHPLLFLPETTVSVELVQVEPELRIIKHEGNIILFLEPFPEEEDSYLVVQETGNRFLYYSFNERHRQLARTLGDELQIPEEGEALARKAADSLSTMITVQSDIGGGTDARRVKADSTPHVQLLPMGKGLRVENLVKPFATGGPSFHPGEGSKSVLAEVEGEQLRAVRDLQAEQHGLEHLVDNCPTMQHYENETGVLELSDPEDCLELLLELGRLEDVVLEWPKGKSFEVHSEVGFDQLALRVNKDREWFKATGSLQVDDDMVLDLQELLTTLRNTQGRFMRLDDGSYLALTQAFRNRLNDLNAFSTQSGKGARFNPLASLALDDLLEQAGSFKGDAAWKTHVEKLTRPVDSKVPSTLQAELRPYQQDGFHWLSRLAHWGVGACLADDMGLGKTLQALSVLLTLAPGGPILVVAPLSVVANWEDEARRFAPTLNVMRFGPGDRQEMVDNLQPFDLLLVSYGLLPLEAERLQKVSWQAVVLDEAQAIKNRQTKRSRAAMKLQAEFRLITTGTPVENHLGELWTLFQFLNPGLLGSYKQFSERFGNCAEQDAGKECRRQLRRLIRPFILRRLKSEVLTELPPRTDVTLRVSMSEQEQALYEAKRRQALTTLERGDDEAGHLQILAEIMQLRRLCCNPALVLGDEAGKKKIASSKLKVFGDTVAELIDNKHKALVFSQFVGHLALIRAYLDQQKISYQYLDGQTSAKQRQKRIRAFQAGEGDLFLISLKAGGSGLNLTAADYVIHMDPWWNPAVEDQASDRAHRIGQQRPVTVYRLVMEGTIEEQIVELHQQKRDLADSLLEGSDMSGRMSADDLLQLLREQT